MITAKKTIHSLFAEDEIASMKQLDRYSIRAIKKTQEECRLFLRTVFEN